MNTMDKVVYTCIEVIPDYVIEPGFPMSGRVIKNKHVIGYLDKDGKKLIGEVTSHQPTIDKALTYLRWSK